MSAVKVGLAMAIKDYPGLERTLRLWRDGHGIEAVLAARAFETLLWLIGWDDVEVVPVSKDRLLVIDNDSDYAFEIIKKGRDHRRGST